MPLKKKVLLLSIPIGLTATLLLLALPATTEMSATGHVDRGSPHKRHQKLLLSPSQSLMRFADELITASNQGDAEATFRLSELLRDCRSSQKHPGQIEDRETNIALMNHTPDAPFKWQADDCNDLLEDYGRIDWLLISAEQGSVRAILAYVAETHELERRCAQDTFGASAKSRTEKSISHLTLASSKGSEEALYALSNELLHQAQNDDMRISALANRLAYSIVTGKPMEGWEIAKFKSPLSNMQLNEAQRRAACIIEQHRKANTACKDQCASVKALGIEHQ